MKSPIAHAACKNRTIFLDLAEGRYFCLDPARDIAFRQLLGGDRSDLVMAALLPLFDKGFQLPAAPGDMPAHVGEAYQVASCDRATDASSIKPAWLFLPLVWWSLAWARLTIKRHGFCGVVDKVDRWSRRPAVRKPSAGNTGLLAIFRISRPYMPWKKTCLVDSLALLRFLRLFNVSATLVVGVTDQPFSAHCWLQDGNCVINDSLEHIANFEPIAAWDA